MYNAIIIAGPTGVGKTELSIRLAKMLNAEIISADSSQVYRYMDIGTAKIKEYEKEGVKHHLIDIVNPDETYSVGKFYEDCNEILNRDDKIYILVGGTGLYLDAITEGLSKMPEVDLEYRKKLESMTTEELLLLVENKDNLDINNRQRIIRRIETKGIINEKIVGNNRKFLKIFLERDRENLYNRINKRVDIMFDEGLEKEARRIFENYNNITSIGYKELFSYFKGEISINEAKEEIKKASRRYAKRQFTWFRDKGYTRYNLDYENTESVLEKIRRQYGY